jgi:hypothetical protein
MYIHTGEWLGQPQVPGSTSDYIRWVQRSLNLRGDCIQVNGLDSPGYRAALNHPKTGRLGPNATRQFQEVALFLDPNIKVDGVAGPKTEAAIVRLAFTQPPGECV